MFKQLSIIAILFISTSCNNKTENVNLQQGIKTDTTIKASQIIFSEPQTIDSSSIVIYPLILEKTTYGGSYGSSSSGGGEKISYWNLIFYNTETATKHLLTTKNKILIYSINMGGFSSSSSGVWTSGINIFKDNIIYTVVSKDHNQNKSLDQDDPTYLFVSTKQGNDFRQISPDDYNITSWEVIKGTTKIIMQGQKDENGDKKFDQNDKTIPLIVDLGLNKQANETFENSYIDSLKKNLIGIWKQQE
jgi:hypothetical protein